MFKQQKGITLIALVITIIVLLILAGVTIAMLTGSDSAPVKANEAKQKQDIGAAKDQIYVKVADYQTTAFDNVYVQAKSADGTSTLAQGTTNKQNDVGTTVGKNVVDYFKLDANNDVGNAHISVKTITGTYTAEILVKTTDWEVTGHISQTSGTLSWGDIVSAGTNKTTEWAE